MKAIVAVDRNFAIGYRGNQLYTFSADRRFFMRKTLGHVIVAGRKTFATFPGGVALKGRQNVVLTKSRMLCLPGADVFHSAEDALRYLKRFPTEEIYVVGGEAVYKSFLPYCDEAFVTWVDAEFEADTHFPDLDADPEWELVWESGDMIAKDLRSNDPAVKDPVYRNRRYQRRSGGVS